jgi:hypothetical protein
MARKKTTRRRNLWPFGPGQPLGSRTTVRHVSTPKSKSRASRASDAYRGYTIYKQPDGYFTVPQLSGARFYSKKIAKEAIDYEKAGVPKSAIARAFKNPGPPILDLVTLAQDAGVFGGGKKSSRRKNSAKSAWIRAKAIRIRRSRGKVLVDVFR